MQIGFPEGTALTAAYRWYIARKAWRNTCLWLPIISDLRIWCDSTCKFGAGSDEFAILSPVSPNRRAEKSPAKYVSLVSRTRFSRAARVVRNRRVDRRCEHETKWVTRNTCFQRCKYGMIVGKGLNAEVLTSYLVQRRAADLDEYMGCHVRRTS